MATDPDIRRSRRTLIIVGLIGLLMGLVYASAELAPVDWDPAGVIGVGEEDAVRIQYAESIFGREIPLTETVGHDGRFFFIQAMDPLLLDPQRNAAFLDRPTYRSQRMLYPALAGLAGPLGPDAVAWAMIAVNVAAFAVGTVGTARLAELFGLSTLWGLAFAFNPGVRFELDIAGAGVVAFAAVAWGLVYLKQGRARSAAVALALGVLAREVMIVAALGAALAKGIRTRRDRVMVVGVPAVAGAAWWGYVQVRAGDLASEAAVQEIGLPLQGFFGALRLWLEQPGIDFAMGLTYLVLAILMVVRAARRGSLLEMPAAGFGVLALLLTRQVWFRHFDISRALSPLLTLFLLSLAVSVFGRTPQRPSETTAPKQDSVIE
jgi:hypothetical protein